MASPFGLLRGLLGLLVFGSLATAQAQTLEEATARVKAAKETMGITDPGDAAAPFLPNEYITSRDPPGMESRPPAQSSERPQSERSQAVNGQNYTVVSPIFLGGGPDGGNTSYIRFYNRETHTSVFRVNIVGYRTDSTTDSFSTIIGAATVTVPDGASPQYSIADIFNAAGIPLVACPTTCPANTYQGVALYMTNVDDDVGFQHVIHNANSRFFENVTLCADDSMSDGSSQRYMGSLVNVHSYSYYMYEYPSSLIIHNYAATNGTYEFWLKDSRTGTIVGFYRGTLLANSTYVVPMRALQDLAGFVPQDVQSHINIEVFRMVGSSVQLTNAVIGQLIYNQALQAYINMSQVCKLLH